LQFYALRAVLASFIDLCQLLLLFANFWPWGSGWAADKTEMASRSGEADQMATTGLQIASNWRMELGDADRVRRLGEEIDVAIAAAQQWQPIETAPKGTAILIYANGYNVAHYTASGHWFSYGDKAETHILNTWGKPTHWMPLPTPLPNQPRCKIANTPLGTQRRPVQKSDAPQSCQVPLRRAVRRTVRRLGFPKI